MNARPMALLAAGALAAGLLSGCDYEGASSLPLPGGAGEGGYEITMVFDDVTNLVPQETCRAGDVVVGSVRSIELRDDLTAEVVCQIDPDVELAGNAVATLRETSLLGERFVALDPPAGVAAVGVLEPGAELAQADSHVVPDVEVVLGALSQVLNGGGLAHLETISRELTIALAESDLGGTTRRLATLMDTLDDNRDDITLALEAVNRLAGGLADQREVIADALDAVPGGLAVLERQRPRVIKLLGRLGNLSDTAVPLIQRVKADTVADLEHLGPVLENLARSKKRLANALEGIITFPFPSYTKYVTQGDYAGMYATFNLDLDSLNKLAEQHSPVQNQQAATQDAEVPDLELPELPELPDLSLEELLELLPDLGLDLGQAVPPLGLRSEAAPPRTLAELLTGGGGE